MFASALAIIQDIFWLIVRGKKRKDANAPQAAIDVARNAAASGDADTLNASLDAARDRLQESDHSKTDTK